MPALVGVHRGAVSFSPTVTYPLYAVFTLTFVAYRCMQVLPMDVCERPESSNDV